VKNVYLPQIPGKERRKRNPSSDGVLGVEGISDQIIIDAFKRAGITGEKLNKNGRKITKTDLFNIGVSGTEGAAARRAELCKFFGFPGFLTANSLIDVLNSLYGYDDFILEVKKWSQE
jgi:ribonuclease M5